MKKIFKFLKRLATDLSLTTDITDAEKLANLTKEQKIENLLADIKRIRRAGGYEPNYNKPPLYKDYPIEVKIITSCPRPVDFGNDIISWFESVKIDYQKELENKRVDKEMSKSFIQERQKYVNHTFSRFMKVN